MDVRGPNPSNDESTWSACLGEPPAITMSEQHQFNGWVGELGRILVRTVVKGDVEFTLSHEFKDGELVRIDCDILSEGRVCHEVKVGVGGFSFFENHELPRTLVLAESDEVKELCVWSLRSPSTSGIGPPKSLVTTFVDVIFYVVDFDWWERFQ